uniref:hypothetical protein n=1 Tax=Roseomonas chloroacetimidivorans TaxID=1766656 RepID=UPI003C724CEE
MSTQRWPLVDLLSRSTDVDFAETTLAKVLAGLPPLTSQGPWLAGGALRRTLLGQEPKSDFDMFFRDADQLAAYLSKLEASGFRKVRETEHHVHLRGAPGEMKLEIDVQLIRFAFYLDAEAVLDSFDFTICQFAYDGETLTAGEFALWDLGRKRLAIHRVSFPVSTMRRMIKYASQGFTA